MGFKLKSLDLYFQNQFIHYGAFSKNRGLSGIKLRIYRILAIYSKIGFGKNMTLSNLLQRVVLKIFLMLYKDFNESRKKYD